MELICPLTLIRIGLFIRKMSLCIQSSSYNPETREMIIEFIARGTYKYFEVEQETFDALNGAVSQGEFFNLMIRDSGYSFEKVG